MNVTAVTDLKQFDLPPLIRPPFYLPLDGADEFRRRFGETASIPDGLDPWREGWELSFFSVRVSHIRLTDIGWVKGRFAISPFPTACGIWTYKVTHLDSGKAIAMCIDRRTAADLVETVEGIDGWQEVTTVGAPPAVLDAYFDTLREAGFFETLKDFGEEFTAVVWTRSLS